MNPYKIAIIGLGQIASSYHNALESLNKYNLVAVCDLNPYAVSKEKYRDYPFYTNYMDMIKNHQIDIIIISTPPITHTKIALDVMSHQINVLLEKPGLLNLIELTQLLQSANKNNVKIDTIFHWQHANEVLFIKKYYPNIKKATYIKTEIYDPYTINKKFIKKEKIPLHGAWFDSGVNALSMMSLFIDINDYTMDKKVNFIDPKSNLPYYANRTYKQKNLYYSILVNWRYHKNYKRTRIKLDDKMIKIIHHLEEVYENNHLIYKSNERERLSSHYHNYFKDFKLESVSNHHFELIHRKLIEGI